MYKESNIELKYLTKLLKNTDMSRYMLEQRHLQQ